MSSKGDAVEELDRAMGDSTPSPEKNAIKELKSILSSLHDEYKADCVVNYGNIGDVVMKVPAIKQKWVSRYCRYRNMATDVEKKLAEETEAEIKRIMKESPVAMTAVAASKAVAKSDNKVLAALRERQDLLRRICDDLSEILKHVHFLNTEIATIVDFMKMENS